MTFSEAEHEAAAELLGVYALDAVEADEARGVEQHLERCARCRMEVDQLRAIAAALGSQASAVGDEPPPAVWERLSAAIASPAPASAQSPPTLAAPGAGTGAGIAGAAATVTPISAAARRRRRIWTGAVAVAAAAVVAALSFGLVNAEGRVSQLRSALDRQPGAAVRAALAAPGHRVLELRAVDGRGDGKVVLDRSGVGYVVSSAMPTLPSGETYQLWASVNGQAISLGLLGQRSLAGDAFSLGSSISAARELMVTVEPTGGVVSPDRAPIATAKLAVS